MKKLTLILVLSVLTIVLMGCTNAKLKNHAEDHLVDAIVFLIEDINSYIEIDEVLYTSVIFEIEESGIKKEREWISYHFSFKQEGFPKRYFADVYGFLNINGNFSLDYIDYYETESSWLNNYNDILDSLDDESKSDEYISFRYVDGSFSNAAIRRAYNKAI
jgi:hypothetical protein